MNKLKWTMACLVAVGLLAGSGCSKTEEKIGKLEARIEALERQNATGTVVTNNTPPQANMNVTQ
jgi:hypothetical protein